MGKIISLFQVQLYVHTYCVRGGPLRETTNKICVYIETELRNLLTQLWRLVSPKSDAEHSVG